MHDCPLQLVVWYAQECINTNDVVAFCLYLMNSLLSRDAYARLSAECSIEGLGRSIIKVVWCQLEIILGIFITT